jgi:hypothetical protein
MPTITTYATLRDAVSGAESWTHRTDVLNRFDEFLQLVEGELYIGGHKSNGQFVSGLRVREMETRSTASLSTSSRFLALPDNFIEPRRAELEYTDANSNKIVYELKFVSPNELKEVTSAGLPRRYTVTSQYEFDCTPDIAYTMEVQHYAKVAALSSSNTTNTLLTNYPSIYLYGCVAQAARWAEKDRKALFYYDLFLNAIEKASAETDWSRFGPSPQMIYHGSIA